jgi:UDP-N-acetyl-D-mannosaminuronic acid dehydrogenase
MPAYVLSTVRRVVAGTRDATITVFAVADKGNVDYARETPALKFVNLAENEG